MRRLRLAFDALGPSERAALRAELKEVNGGVTEHRDRVNPADTVAIRAARKRSVARTHLAALEATIAESQPQAQLGEVFQQVARNELDPVTYQRLVIMAQQRLLLQRK